jgi:TPP-dependent pyruvate/acetoin dehydrogenase alpha subunit
VEFWLKREPIAPYRQHLIDQGVLTATDADAIESNVLEELSQAVEFARTSPLPEPESALEDLWA